MDICTEICLYCSCVEDINLNSIINLGNIHSEGVSNFCKICLTHKNKSCSVSEDC